MATGIRITHRSLDIGTVVLVLNALKEGLPWWVPFRWIVYRRIETIVRKTVEDRL